MGITGSGAQEGGKNNATYEMLTMVLLAQGLPPALPFAESP